MFARVRVRSKIILIVVDVGICAVPVRAFFVLHLWLPISDRVEHKLLAFLRLEILLILRNMQCFGLRHEIGLLRIAIEVGLLIVNLKLARKFQLHCCVVCVPSCLAQFVDATRVEGVCNRGYYHPVLNERSLLHR
jgi:hypothetical protein